MAARLLSLKARYGAPAKLVVLPQAAAGFPNRAGATTSQLRGNAGRWAQVMTSRYALRTRSVMAR
jgi:hypothetical protein